MADTLRIAASAANEAEAEMILGRLSDAGIHGISQRNIGGPEWGGSGTRSVFVQEADLEKARALLATDPDEFSDEELTRLSEEAGRGQD